MLLLVHIQIFELICDYEHLGGNVVGSILLRRTWRTWSRTSVPCCPWFVLVSPTYVYIVTNFVLLLMIYHFFLKANGTEQETETVEVECSNEDGIAPMDV